MELRRWIAELETNSGSRREDVSDIVPDGTTKIVIPDSDS
jgi:hypothetical protein